MITFTFFLGLGFAILAMNDIIDQTQLTTYSNINLFNMKVCTAIILFTTFIVVFHTLLTRMNALQDTVMQKPDQGLEILNKVKCRTTMKIEPYKIATIIASEQEGWRITKVSDISKGFQKKNTFYIKQTGSETYYSFTLTETGF